MTTTRSVSASLNNPFPGLRPFRDGEEHLFFGRESQTDEMVDKLAQTRFLAVIGSSGSGKSSLVNCGLRVALRGGLMPSAGTAWKMVQCRPEGRPIASLAEALARDGLLFSKSDFPAMNLADMIDSNLRMSKLGVIDVFEQARVPKNTNLLIVIDQFEELFRFQQSSTAASPRDSTEEARAFVKLILEAANQSQYPIYVVLTMRSDFLGDCTRFEALAEAINGGQYLVPRMTRNERRMAIAGPVAVAGASIDDVLLTKLVNDLGDDPDQLSILQHALSRIWIHWASLDDPDSALNLKHYMAIGSMANALDNHAEEAFGELDGIREQRLCEKLFKALTNKATDPRGVRRPTRLDLLTRVTESSEDDLIRIIDVFRQSGRSFLMPPPEESLSEHSVIDISHESLMRQWKRLVDWANEEAISSQTFIRLSATADLHAHGKAGLWRDPDLQIALEWRQHNEPNAIWASRIGSGFDTAMQFLDDSRAADDHEKSQQLKVAEQERELEHAKAIASEQEQRIKAERDAAGKQKKILFLIIGGLITTTLLSLFGLDQNRDLKQEEKEYSQLRAVAASDTIKGSTVWQLLRLGGLTAFDIPATQQFVNRSDSVLQLFTLNEQGHETFATLLPADSSAPYTLEGAVRQIWVARKNGAVLAAGIMQHVNDTYTFR